MRAIIRLIYGGLQTRVTVVNTKIGGVFATLGTAQLLATKLGINVNRITDFSIIGNDIQCSISGQYALPNQAFAYNTDITYYKDYNNLMTSLAQNAIFYGCTKLTEILLKGVTDIGGANFINTLVKEFYFPDATIAPTSSFSSVYEQIVYIPLVLNLGEPSVNNNVFGSSMARGTVYLNPVLATNNAGGEDGDIVYLRGIGCSIRYVYNYIKPLAATLSNFGVINNTSIKMVDLGNSNNAIDYFEVSINGGSIRKAFVNQYLTGLTKNTNHSISITAVDMCYNKSNPLVLNVTTSNSTSAFPTTGLKSYYRLDENSGLIAFDSYGTDHLTNNNVVINKVGKITNSYQSTGGNQSLATTSGTPIVGKFTINLWVYRTATAQDYSALYDQGNFNDGTGFGIWCNTANNLSWRINQNFNHYNASTNLPLNTWTMVTVVYNGVNVKTYINAVLKQTDAMTANPNSSTKKSVFYGHNGAMFYGKENDISIHDIDKTQAEIDVMYNGGNGITL